MSYDWIYEVCGIEYIAFLYGFIYQGEECEKKEDEAKPETPFS